MAVLHFKTKGGLVAFVVISMIVMSIPLIQYVGAGGFVALTLLGIVILVPIVLIVNGDGHLTARGRYAAAVNNSSGIEKLRLKIRSNSTALSSKLGEDTSIFGITLLAAETHIHLADIFYSFTKEQNKGTSRSELFDELSEDVVLEDKKESVVSARLFGIAFGISVEKAADAAKLKVKKAAVKDFIGSCTFSESDKKEFSKMVMAYLDLQKSDTRKTKRTLEEMTYALFDATIKRDKDDAPDPIAIMPLKAAISYAKNATLVDDLYVKDFKKAGLIG